MLVSPSSQFVCTSSVDDVFFQLQSSEEGLTAKEAALRLSTFGRNEMPEEEEEPLWKKFLDKLKEPMIALLMCSSGVSLLTGQYHDAISIFIVRLNFGSVFHSSQTPKPVFFNFFPTR